MFLQVTGRVSRTWTSVSTGFPRQACQGAPPWGWNLARTQLAFCRNLPSTRDRGQPFATHAPASQCQGSTGCYPCGQGDTEAPPEFQLSCGVHLSDFCVRSSCL